MSLHRLFFITVLSLFCAETVASATSLDDIYRDIIRSNNSGYLPLFVKNRQNRDGFLSNKTAPVTSKLSLKPLPSDPKIRLSPSIDSFNSLSIARHNLWLQAVAAVKTNQVTPLEFNEIYTRAYHNDPKAVEILAWMYAKGIGVTPNLTKAFKLYKKAATLGVANSEKNASAVYMAMSPQQRHELVAN